MKRRLAIIVSQCISWQSYSQIYWCSDSFRWRCFVSSHTLWLVCCRDTKRGRLQTLI